MVSVLSPLLIAKRMPSPSIYPFGVQKSFEFGRESKNRANDVQKNHRRPRRVLWIVVQSERGNGTAWVWAVWAREG